jgi:drug/metabolite transporter (DMT)-like permease
LQILVFIILCIIWGTTWLAIKISLTGIPPFLGAALRFMVASLLLLIYARVTKASLRMSGSDFRNVFLSAILLYPIDYGLIYWSEQHLSAGVTAIFFATFPLFMSIFSNFVFKNETFSKWKFSGVVVGLSGVILIFYDQLLLTNYEFMVIIAIIAVIVSAAAAATSTLIVKKHLHHVPTAPLTLHQMLWGLIFLFIISLFMGETTDITINLKVVGAVLYLGAFGSAVAFVMYYWLLKRLSAISISFIIYITPVVAIIADWLVFGETIALKTFIGMLLIFAGIALSQKGRIKRKRTVQVVD